MTGTRVLVTGGGGFLGQAVAERLHARRDDVLSVGRHGVEGEVRFQAAVLPSPAFDDLVDGFRPQVLVHAAGPASVAASIERPADDFRGSVEVYASTLDSVRRHAPGCRVIFLSSAAVYGEPERLPVAEDAARRPVSPYGYHKRMCEDLGEEYARLFGVPACSLRVFSAYGEGLRRQVVYETARRCLAGDEVELFGTGDETRDFIHADDVAQAVERVIAARPGDVPPALNVATGVETSIRELAERIRAACNPRARIRFNGQSRPGDPRRWHADVGSLVRLGFVPRRALADTVPRLVKHWAAEQAREGVPS